MTCWIARFFNANARKHTHVHLFRTAQHTHTKRAPAKACSIGANEMTHIAWDRLVNCSCSCLLFSIACQKRNKKWLIIYGCRRRKKESNRRFCMIENWIVILSLMASRSWYFFLFQCFEVVFCNWKKKWNANLTRILSAAKRAKRTLSSIHRNLAVAVTATGKHRAVFFSLSLREYNGSVCNYTSENSIQFQYTDCDYVYKNRTQRKVIINGKSIVSALEQKLDVFNRNTWNDFSFKWCISMNFYFAHSMGRREKESTCNFRKNNNNDFDNFLKLRQSLCLFGHRNENQN